MKTSLPSFRRYSDSCLLETANGYDRLSTLQDLVSTNNHKNVKLNELSQSASEEKTVEDNEEGDEIEDDWFSKLVNSKDCPRVPPVDGSLSDYGSNITEIPLLCDEDLDFKEKTIKTLRVGLKKIWRRGSATITAEDPTYKVAYLGNVLTGLAKGEGCIDKPLNTLWKNYRSWTKPDVQMKITVTQSGLKAVTKDHGLIEYWSHRITYCSVPPELPRIFCWVYRHEGRKLKPELRCHAVLCSKESVAMRMAVTLKIRLTQALLEFKRDKLLRQNARLSLANSVYDNPSLPRRKILLSTGSHNYKPPLERSKSAPKLKPIEESLEEEENTPKTNRKLFEDDEVEERGNEKQETQPKKSNPDEKCEYKLTNLNFVKKLCTSIENLVESTSNYSKKLLTDRKSSKNIHITVKNLEESILKNGKAEDDSTEASKKSKSKKNVSFDVNRSDCSELAKCTEYKKLEEEENVQEPKPTIDVTVEVRDQESDEGSNSFQSISSCCSNMSSLATNSSDKSTEPPLKSDQDLIFDCQDCETSMERLHTYLNSYNNSLLEDVDKVRLHPTAGEESETGASLKEVNGLRENFDDPDSEVLFENNGYVDLTDTLVNRLKLDSKEKDIPFHKIIKSTALSSRRVQPSCLQI